MEAAVAVGGSAGSGRGPYAVEAARTWLGTKSSLQERCSQKLSCCVPWLRLAACMPSSGSMETYVRSVLKRIMPNECSYDMSDVRRLKSTHELSVVVSLPKTDCARTQQARSS